MRTNRLTAWLATAALALAAAAAGAQEFPSRPITLVAPFPPGTVTDNVTRPLAQALQEILGQTVIVDNRAGAQGVIGATFVARSKPDGYTLLVGSSTMFVGTSLYKNVPYDPLAFQPVANIGSTSMMFMVRESSPIKTLADFIEAAKSQREPVNVGFGSPSAQMVMTMFANAAAVKLTPISYRGTPQALIDLAGGQVDAAVVDIGNGVAQIHSGRLRALAISANSRSSAVPGVPTLAETFPGVAMETIIAVVAPAGTPPPIVDRLDRAIRSALARPEIKARYAALTTEVKPLSATELTRLLKTDVPKWEALIKGAGIEPQ